LPVPYTFDKVLKLVTFAALDFG